MSEPHLKKNWIVIKAFKVWVHYDRNWNDVGIHVDKHTAKILIALLHESQPQTPHFQDVCRKIIELIEREINERKEGIGMTKKEFIGLIGGCDDVYQNWK
jgi:hypothetical protein